MSGLGEAHGEIGASGRTEEDRLAAEERIDDIEAEFGPDAPPRGATPDNPDAEEHPV